MAAAATICMLTITGCGGGGGSAPAAVSSPTSASAASSGASFTLTGDSYGLQNATYLSATSAGAATVLRAAIASSMTDPGYRTVCRIDIADTGAISAGAVYSLAPAGARPFPGTVYFFNGHQSTRLRTAGGTVTFDSFGKEAGDTISGYFEAVVVDGNDTALPAYRICARFAFISDAAAPIAPAPVPVPPAAAILYGAHCAPCHSLGSLDTTPGSGPELALKGGRVGALFTGGDAGHQAITLDDAAITALQILLNAH